MWQLCIATLCVCTYIHTYVCMQEADMSCVRTYVHAYTCIYICTYINVRVRTYMTRMRERMMLQVAVMVCIRLQMTGVGCGVVHVRTSSPTDLSIDAMDVSGEQQFDVMHNIVKQRLSPEGSVVQEKELESEQSRCVCSCACASILLHACLCTQHVVPLLVVHISVYCVCVCVWAWVWVGGCGCECVHSSLSCNQNICIHDFSLQCL